MSKYLFTSESVTEGHPDKMCDQISDAVLDSALSQDKESRVACEVLTTTGLVLIAGEISTDAYIDIQGIARDTIKDIGYIDPEYGFDYQSCSVLTSIHSQSPDIAQGVDTGGAGDQGMMFGFACKETKELMPLPIMISHKLVRKLANYRKENNTFLRPDGKAQITVEYVNNKPERIDTVVLSTQHSPEIKYSELKELVFEEIIKNSLPKDLLDDKTIYHINPTGKFVSGGPAADSGLTGRKIIVDTYGGYSRHGGGAFSGKDASKVDRSGAYMARYLAKNIVASGIVDKCEIELAYAIGVCEPVSIYIEDFNTSKIPLEKLIKTIKDNVDLTPKGIIEKFSLKQPIFKKTAAYGHFGREEFPWEKLDLAEKFK